jgi:hypothetical protein
MKAKKIFRKDDASQITRQQPKPWAIAFRSTEDSNIKKTSMMMRRRSQSSKGLAVSWA